MNCERKHYWNWLLFAGTSRPDVITVAGSVTSINISNTQVSTTSKTYIKGLPLSLSEHQPFTHTQTQPRTYGSYQKTDTVKVVTCLIDATWQAGFNGCLFHEITTGSRSTGPINHRGCAHCHARSTTSLMWPAWSRSMFKQLSAKEFICDVVNDIAASPKLVIL